MKVGHRNILYVSGSAASKWFSQNAGKGKAFSASRTISSRVISKGSNIGWSIFNILRASAFRDFVSSRRRF